MKELGPAERTVDHGGSPPQDGQQDCQVCMPCRTLSSAWSLWKSTTRRDGQGPVCGLTEVRFFTELYELLMTVTDHMRLADWS